MRHLLFLFIFLLIKTSLWAQIEPDAALKPKNTDRFKLAASQIAEMHQGVLLVRLITKKNSIAQLRELGRNKLADRIENEQTEKNKQIIAAFEQYFDFCPTYYFYSHFSQKVQEKKLKEVEFLNAHLEVDTTINLNDNHFFIAEFTAVESASKDHYSGEYQVHTENGVAYRGHGYVGSNIDFNALIIKNSQFAQLERPFPFYVRTLDSLPFKIKRSYKDVVVKMNIQLHKYLEKHHEGIANR